MDVSTGLLVLYVGVATGAFLITQLHLWKTGTKLIRKSDESWARVDATIANVQADFQAQIDQIRTDVKSSGGNDAKSMIAELGSLKIKLEGIPNYLEDRLSKVSANMSENFVLLQKALDQRIDEFKKIQTGTIGTIVDPREAQVASVQKRKVNEIVNRLDEAALGQTFGGRMAMILDSLGEPAMKEWMMDHPQAYPMLVQEIKRRPALASRMDAIMGQVEGTAPQGQSQPGNESRSHFARRVD